MKCIDVESWERKEHFAFFQSRRNPCLCVTAPIDISALLERRKASATSIRLTDCLYYAATKAANAVVEFRYRLIDRKPVEFAKVDTAFTYVPAARKLHANCVAPFDEDFAVFTHNVETARRQADQHPSLTPKGSDSQALIYFSCVSSIAFTSVTNPWGDPWQDSVPRVIFGKYNADDMTMPVSIEALHSFIDGMHIAAYLQCLEQMLVELSSKL